MVPNIYRDLSALDWLEYQEGHPVAVYDVFPLKIAICIIHTAEKVNI